MEKKKRKEEEGSKQNGDAKKKTRRYGGTGVWDCRSQCCGAAFLCRLRSGSSQYRIRLWFRPSKVGSRHKRAAPALDMKNGLLQ